MGPGGRPGAGLPLGDGNGAPRWKSAGFEAVNDATLAAGPWPMLARYGRRPAVRPARPTPSPRAGQSVARRRRCAAEGRVGAPRASDRRVRRRRGDRRLRPERRRPDRNDPAGARRAGPPLPPRAAQRRVGRSGWSPQVRSKPVARCRSAVSLTGAALWGLGRVVINEMPGLDLRLVDLPIESTPADQRHAPVGRAGGGG